MDEGWGNIIYLLLLIILGVFGALKKKKPVAVAPPTDEDVAQQQVFQSPKSEKKLDSVLEALLGQEVPDPYLKAYEEETAAPVAEKEVVLDSVSEPLDVKEMSIEYTDNLGKSIFDDMEELQEDDKKNEMEEVDWQKAIVYKEILDRKYN